MPFKKEKKIDVTKFFCCDPLNEHPHVKKKRNLRKISSVQLEKCKELELHAESRLCIPCRKRLATADVALLEAAASTHESPSEDDKGNDNEKDHSGPSGVSMPHVELEHELSVLNESLNLLGGSSFKKQKLGK